MGIAQQISHGGKYFPAHELQGAVIPRKKMCVCGWMLPSKLTLSVIATKENFLPNKGIMGVMVTAVCPKCGMPWRSVQNERSMSPA